MGRFSTGAHRDGTVTEEDGDFYRAVGITLKVNGPEDVDAIARMAGVEPLVVVDSSAWRIIPAENLVAKFGATDEPIVFGFRDGQGRGGDVRGAGDGRGRRRPAYR